MSVLINTSGLARLGGRKAPVQTVRELLDMTDEEIEVLGIDTLLNLQNPSSSTDAARPDFPGKFVQGVVKKEAGSWKTVRDQVDYAFAEHLRWNMQYLPED